MQFPRAMRNEGRISATGTKFASILISWRRAGKASWVTVLADEGNPLPAAPGCPSSAVQRHPVTGHNPQEGADLAAKPHSSDVTGGLPPSFYSAAYCICRYMHQQGSKCLFGGLYLIAKELCSVKQSGILQWYGSLVVTCSLYSNQSNIIS